MTGEHSWKDAPRDHTLDRAVSPGGVSPSAMSKGSESTSTSPHGTQVAQRARRLALAVHEVEPCVVQGPSAGIRRRVQSPRISLGTASNNDFVLNDDTVSRHHAELTFRGDSCVVRDLESTNGTFVDGVEIREAVIHGGQRLTVGESTIELRSTVSWDPLHPSEERRFGTLVGDSPSMSRVFGLLSSVAKTRLTCLFNGPTGTGKELAARSVHEASDRRDGPFVVVDCGALADELVESELFGHERGSFTGAIRDHVGAFERAHGGTIFLDEIGELALETQPKLLRALERREIRRVGGQKTIDVDVRVLAATHRDLLTMSEVGEFREDLYHRVAEVVVSLPALSERPEDIPLLAEEILSREVPAGRIQVSREALTTLQRRHYPGNVRELRTLLRRAIALSTGRSIDADVIGQAEQLGHVDASQTTTTAHPTVSLEDGLPLGEARDRWLAVLEPMYLRFVLDAHEGNATSAANHAGVHVKYFRRLLRRYDVRRRG